MNAVITGASQGLGESVARILAGAGFDLVLAARSLDKLQSLKKELEEEFGVKVYPYSVDFSKRFEVENFAQSLLHQFEQLDIVVNNVGTYTETVFGESDGIDKMLGVNFRGTYTLMNRLVPFMKKTQKGHLFHVCSVLSKSARLGAADYSISKHALYALHLSLVEEFKSSPLKSTALLPGAINTPSWDGSDAPVEEFVQAVDIARSILFASNCQPGTQVDEISFSPLNPNF